MRSAFLTATILSILSAPAMAADNMLVMPHAPWEEETKTNTKDIVPQKISLADLEKISGLKNDTETPAVKSSLEKLYSQRIVDELEQYGYDLFDNEINSNSLKTIPAGTIQNDYILSTGDTLNIILRGQTNLRQNYIIDNQGMLIVEDFPPITAAGRKLRDVQTDLQLEAAKLHNTQIFTSLADVRQIGVLVVGHVKKPGRKNLTAFHTVLDALSLAHGIEKTGSLRRIKLVRKGKSYFIDLYQLLMASGGGGDRLLQDGDRIIVPPIGPTMAVSGSIKRPAIYEIRKGEKISLHQALGLGGGALTPGQNRYMKLEYTTQGDETVRDIGAPKERIFGDGSILMVAQSQQKRKSEVTLSGHTRQPGSHDLKKAKTLSDLINSEKVLGNDIYPLIGVIERRDTKQLTKQLIPFSPFQVLHRQENKKLNEGDKVCLFSANHLVCDQVKFS